MSFQRRRANVRLKASAARTTRGSTLGTKTWTERQAAAHVTAAAKPSPPSGLLAGPKAAVARLITAAGGKPKPVPLKGPSAYTLTDKAFRLVHPTGPAHPDFYDSNDAALIESWIEIWNWVDWYQNRTAPPSTGTSAILATDPLKSWGVPFGEGVDPNPVWPIVTQECAIAFLGNHANTVGEPLQRFGAARPSQGWTQNRIHIGADLVGLGGDVVVAPEAGVIGGIRPFYSGTEALLLWLPNDTTVVLGEVAPGSYDEFGVEVGDTVQKGQPVARIGTFAPEQQLDYDMLHVEMFKGHRGASANWYDGSSPPTGLLNPTKYVLSASCH